jgi:SAM-dependent methyltransferase
MMWTTSPSKCAPSTQCMEPEQYQVMARRETRHWWYAGMRHVALAVLEHAIGGKSGLRILDAGCGTGGTTTELRRFGNVVGIDLAWEALQPARGRGLAGQLTRGSIEDLPFADAAFDVVTSFEVIYHLGVGSDTAVLVELRRVLKSDGVLLLRVPAHDWLRGEHDRLVHTRHRYSRAEVVAKLTAAGFAVDHVSWANTALFLPAAAKRLLERRNGHTDATGEPDLWLPPEPLNSILESAIAVEALAIPRGVPLPFGLSVLALARAV